MIAGHPTFLFLTFCATLLCSGCQAPDGVLITKPQAKPKPEPLPFAWPPELNHTYPDLVLKNHKGEDVRLSDYKGKLILLEPIGMSCGACNAFAGGHERGGFRGAKVQRDMPSLERLLPDYAGGVGITDRRILHVQLLLYNQNMQAPSVEETAAWAKHFGADRRPNHLVLAGDPQMISQASFNMIPGFQLIDRNFILRADSAGHRPSHNLYTELLPQLGKMVR